MNKQDEELIEFYLKELRKKKIFIFIIVIFLIAGVFMGIYYYKYKQSINNTYNNVQEEILNDNLNDNIDSTDNTLNIVTTVDNVSECNDIKEETKEYVGKENTEHIQPNVTHNNKEQTKEDIVNKTEDKDVNKKAQNRDFLFADGYTMENVTQAAQEYLKSNGCAGECIPLKDNEGVYLGMRVIFH